MWARSPEGAINLAGVGRESGPGDFDVTKPGLVVPGGLGSPIFFQLRALWGRISQPDVLATPPSDFERIAPTPLVDLMRVPLKSRLPARTQLVKTGQALGTPRSDFGRACPPPLGGSSVELVRQMWCVQGRGVPGGIGSLDGAISRHGRVRLELLRLRRGRGLAPRGALWGGGLAGVGSGRRQVSFQRPRRLLSGLARPREVRGV